MALTGEMYDAIVRIVDDRVKEIRVTREMYDRILGSVASLAEAQKRTEERVTELAEAQKRTEERLEGLAEAQKRTEAAITKLTEAMTEMRKEIAGVGETIRFGLEDIARVVLPGWLERHEKVQVGGFERRTLSVRDRQLEFDLYGEGSRGKTSLIVLGEVKSRIHPSDVEEFIRRVEEAKIAIKEKLLPIMFGYWVHPAASLVAKRSGIRLVASYQR